MTRTRRTTDETTKHGTRTAAGQKRTRERRAVKAEALGLVDPGASRREVDAAIKRHRIEFIQSGRKLWEEVADEFVHIVDLELSITQAAVFPFVTLSAQVPMAYAQDLADVVQFGGGPVFARLYKLRPRVVDHDGARLLDRLDALSRSVHRDRVAPHTRTPG